ncbi:MAG: retroviral-like aspartic protease family protein [candidate division KSB1 bacterium]|nr:retroviral-like aspartic protease family protein [candidate division KSB1 bacterium]MDZ7301231.1 retroviral-like aspartic protease family protein [candidate division KSB1 bacterium]MDZ7310545.1 retroviral-like aspartic protease family protein [candidate division KSB1 bacterium]
MGLIYKPVTLIGTKGTKTFRTLMDTGASRCYIRKKEAGFIAPPYKIATPMELRLGKGKTQVDELLVSFIELNGLRMHWAFIIVPKLTEELIIGADFFQRWKIKLDPGAEDIIIDLSALKIQMV